MRNKHNNYTKYLYLFTSSKFPPNKNTTQSRFQGHAFKSCFSRCRVYEWWIAKSLDSRSSRVFRQKKIGEFHLWMLSSTVPWASVVTPWPVPVCLFPHQSLLAVACSCYEYSLGSHAPPKNFTFCQLFQHVVPRNMLRITWPWLCRVPDCNNICHCCAVISGNIFPEILRIARTFANMYCAVISGKISSGLHCYYWALISIARKSATSVLWYPGK